MSQNLGSLSPPCHTMSHFVDPLLPLTCDVIYGWPLTRKGIYFKILFLVIRWPPWQRNQYPKLFYVSCPDCLMALERRLFIHGKWKCMLTGVFVIKWLPCSHIRHVRCTDWRNAHLTGLDLWRDLCFWGLYDVSAKYMHSGRVQVLSPCTLSSNENMNTLEMELN